MFQGKAPPEEPGFSGQTKVQNSRLAKGLDLYVLSLKHRTDRRAWMQDQADRIGLDLCFFDAVNGAETSSQEFAQTFKPHGPLGRFGPGDMACTLSHFRIFERFLSGDALYCAVFEDDARLAEDLGPWLADLSWMPADADVVKLEAGTQKNLHVLLGKPVGTHLCRHLRPLLSRHTGAAGYIISRNAARRVLHLQGLVDMPIDHLLFNPNISKLAARMQIYQITPALVRQDAAAGKSDLHALREKSLPPSSHLFREIKRGVAEISRLPQQLLALATKGARLVQIRWVSKVEAQKQATKPASSR